MQQAELREGQGGWCPSASVREPLKWGQWLQRRVGWAGSTSPDSFVAQTGCELTRSSCLCLPCTGIHVPPYLPSSIVLLNVRSVAFKASGRERVLFGLFQTLLPILGPGVGDRWPCRPGFLVCPCLGGCVFELEKEGGGLNIL